MSDRAKFLKITDSLEAAAHDYFGANPINFESTRSYSAVGKYAGNYRYEFSLQSGHGAGYRGYFESNNDESAVKFWVDFTHTNPLQFKADGDWSKFYGVLARTVRAAYPAVKFDNKLAELL